LPEFRRKMEEKYIERFTVGIESEEHLEFIKKQQSKHSPETLMHTRIQDMVFSLNRMLIESDSPMRVFMTPKLVYSLLMEGDL